MPPPYRFLSIFALLTILALSLAAPGQAFDGRTGEDIVIKADEVVNDDLYIIANNFTLDGTVKGDLVVFGAVITINGTVEGDLIAAGRSIVINGTVADDVRIAGAILQVGKDAGLGDDLVAAGASLETQGGSKVDGDTVGGARQILLAGDVAGNVLVGTSSLEIRGEIGGDVKAEVGDRQQGVGGPPMNMFVPGSEVSMPNVLPGLTISKDASINGDLEYTQSKDIEIPAGVVSGKVTRSEPVGGSQEQEMQSTPAQATVTWTFDLLRNIVTLILIGLLLGWLAPLFIKTLTEKIQAKPLASFGWGIVASAVFFFAILIILAAMIIGGMLFKALTLGGLMATTILFGIFTIFALVSFFVLAVAFITKIAVAWLGGKLLLDKFNPALAEKKFVPLIVGVVILAILMAIPYVGWIFSLLAVLAGLGAIWMWSGELWRARKAAA